MKKTVAGLCLLIGGFGSSAAVAAASANDWVATCSYTFQNGAGSFSKTGRGNSQGAAIANAKRAIPGHGKLKSCSARRYSN